MKKAIVLVVFILILPFIVNIPDAKLSEKAEKIIGSPPAPMNPQTPIFAEL